MNLRDFPDAPPGSYVSDEGWLVIEDEAWTYEEWHTEIGRAYRRVIRPKSPRPKRAAPRRYATEEERIEAHRRARREYNRRRRAA